MQSKSIEVKLELLLIKRKLSLPQPKAEQFVTLFINLQF